MFRSVKEWLRGWLDVPAPSGVKAPKGVTLTTGMGAGAGRTVSPWAAHGAAQRNTGWVYGATRAIAARIAGQPVRVGRKAGKGSPGKGAKAASSAPPWVRAGTVTELDDHQILRVLNSPNPFTTAFEIIFQLVAGLQIYGESFLWLDAEINGPPRLWVIPKPWVTPDPESEEPLSRFIVTPAGSAEQFTLTSDELLRVALPNVGDPFGCTSPLQAAWTSVLADEEIRTAQLASFRQGLLGTTVVKVGLHPEASGVPGPAQPVLTREQRRVLQSLIHDRYAGSDRAGMPIVLDSLIQDVKRISATVAEMDFTNSAGLVKEQILLGFGVNGIVIGQTESANRASATVADENFCYATLAPICTQLGQALTRFLSGVFNDPDLLVWIDPPRPRDPDGRRADLDQLVRAGAVSLDELRAEHGLQPLPDGKGAELVKAPAAVAPAAGPGAGAGKGGLILPGTGRGA